MTDPNRVGDDLFTGSIGNNTGPRRDWTAEETYWRANWSGRPYVSGDRDFEYYRPGYRYGHEAAGRHEGRSWSEVEMDLETGWDRYEHRNDRRWEEVKHAVRDAFDRAFNR